MAEKKLPDKRFSWPVVIVIAFWVAAILYQSFFIGRAQMLPYSRFLKELEADRIAEVSVSAQNVRGRFKDKEGKPGEAFESVRVDDPALLEKLKAAGIPYSGEAEHGWGGLLVSWIVPFLVFLAFWRLAFGRFVQPGGSGFLSIGKAKTKIYVEKGLKTTFEDVAGVDEAKAELSEVVNFLKEPSRYTRLGGRIPKGILLVGPPGTGKTLLARAVAGEAKVPFFSINGSEFVEMFVGVGAARVRDLFDQARNHAPCIIFIDELDALGRSRALGAFTTGANDEKEQTLNQLLAELDGFDPSQGVVLLAATNRPEILDPALLRSGRFDRQILVDKPDKAGRVEILKVHARKIKLAPDLDPETVASLTAGFSGADLANLVNEAALIATRRGAAAVAMEDFTAAIERLVAGLEHKKKIMNPEEKRRVAFHEMGHVTVALSLSTGEKIHKVSVIPRGIGSLGYTIRRPVEDRYLSNARELSAKIAVLLAGRAAEAAHFDDVSTGIHDDLAKATDIAKAMVTQFGMSEKAGLVAFEKPVTAMLGTQAERLPKDLSEKTAQIIDEECSRILSEAYQTALSCVRRHSAFLEAGVAELLERETLGEEEILKLWQQKGGGQCPVVTALPVKNRPRAVKEDASAKP